MKNLRKISLLLSMSLFLFLNKEAFSLTIEELSKGIVYISETKTQIKEKNSKKYEVWLKDTNGKMIPDEYKISATGFLLLHNGLNYIVTAKHVAETITDKARIYFNTKEDKDFFTIKELRSFGGKWFFHPKADVAICLMLFHKNIKPDVANFTTDLFTSMEDTPILGYPVVVLGYPLSLGVENKTLKPLSKISRIASKYISISKVAKEIDPDLKFIVLDSPGVEAYSGAPVTTITTGDTIKVTSSLKMIGVLRGTISDITGGKMTLVVPSFYITEILNSKDFIEYEKSLQLLFKDKLTK